MDSARNVNELSKEKKFEEAAVKDFQLHMQIVQCSGCKLLYEKYEHLLTVCMLYNEIDDMGVFAKNYNAPTKKHTELIDAIATGDPDVAELAVREHICSYAT